MAKKYYKDVKTESVSMAFEMTDYSDDVKSKIESAIKTALKAVGVQAVAHAVTYITASSAVDTGLLRNSITFALGGEAPAKSTYSGGKGVHSGRAGGNGSYSGNAPADTSTEKSVYIGTNVYYAPYVELGTVKMAKRPFIRPAVENFQDKYRQIFERVFNKLKQ